MCKEWAIQVLESISCKDCCFPCKGCPLPEAINCAVTNLKKSVEIERMIRTNGLEADKINLFKEKHKWT